MWGWEVRKGPRREAQGSSHFTSQGASEQSSLNPVMSMAWERDGVKGQRGEIKPPNHTPFPFPLSLAQNGGENSWTLNEIQSIGKSLELDI